MTTYLLSRAASAVPVLFLASIGIFSLVRVIPGDPAVTLAGPDATPQMQAAIRDELGLDEPFVSQYLIWLRDLLTLDFGTSFRLGGDVGDLVADGAANTLLLTGTALLMAATGALITSVVLVGLDRPWLDHVLAVLNTLALAVPSFAVGTLLVLAFAVTVPVLPAGGLPPDGLLAAPDITAQYLVLPALSMALPAWAVLTRYLTEGLRSQMSAPYVTTARAAGVPRRQLVLRHALRNALPPAVTVLGIQIGALLGGSLLIENIFAWPGLGRLLGEAINTRDYPVVQLLLLLSVLAFIAAQLLSDVAQAALDPRVRLKGATT